MVLNSGPLEIIGPEALVNRIYTLTEGTPESYLAFHHMRLRQQGAICEPKYGSAPGIKSAGNWSLKFPASIAVRNMFLLFISYQVYGILFQ